MYLNTMGPAPAQGKWTVWIWDRNWYWITWSCLYELALEAGLSIETLPLKSKHHI